MPAQRGFNALTSQVQRNYLFFLRLALLRVRSSIRMPMGFVAFSVRVLATRSGRRSTSRVTLGWGSAGGAVLRAGPREQPCPWGSPWETRLVPSPNPSPISDLKKKKEKRKKKKPSRVNPISGNNHVGPTILIFHVVHIWKSNSGK